MKILNTQRLTKGSGSSPGVGGWLRRTSILAAAISACYVPTVTAQEGSNFVLEEIVVTVRRRVEMEQDVPISMKAMDAEFLRQQNITELADLGTKIPAVRISNAGTSTNEPIITIRGQRPSTTTLGIDQAASIYFNDVVMTPSQGLNFSLYDLENVQVLKGPQGTLFGRNSTGGAFLLNSKRPGIDFGGFGEITVGSYGLTQFRGAVDLPATDSAQFRVAMFTSNRDGYQNNVSTIPGNPMAGDEEYWDDDTQSVRVSMNLEFDWGTNLTVVEYGENDMAGRIPVPIAFNPESYVGQTIAKPHITELLQAVADQQSRDEFDVTSDLAAQDRLLATNVGNITEVELTDSITFKNIFGYRKVAFYQASDADGTDVALFGARTTDQLLYTTDPELFGTDSEQYSEELQLIGDSFDGSLEWIAGLYWYGMKGTIDEVRTQQSGAIPGYVPGSDPSLGGAGTFLDNVALYGLLQSWPSGDIENEAYAIFGEGTYILNDEWSFTLGLRNSWDIREMTVKNRFNNPDPTRGPVTGRNTICAVTGENGVPLAISEAVNNILTSYSGARSGCARLVREYYSKPTFRFSANYTPVDGMLYYTSLSSGYRAGGFNFRGTTDTSLTPFDEETVLTLELGHKADWGLAGYAPLRSNVAIYHQLYDDIQKTQGFIEPTSGSFGSQTINAGKAVVEGLEFDITWAATENLRMTLAYAWTHTYYKEWDYTTLNTAINGATLANPGVVTVDAKDGEFPYVPKDTANFSIVYDFPIDFSYGELTMAISGYWQGKMPTHANADLFDKGCAIGPYGGIDAYNSGFDCFQGWSAQSAQLSKDAVWVGSYDVWNIRFDWRNVMETPIDLALYSNNVTDERYEQGGLNVIETLGMAAHTYGAPRIYGASIRYNF